MTSAIHSLSVFPSREFASVTCLLFLTALIGCSDGRPQRVPVSGSVVIDGQPLTRGFVRFVPANDRPSSGEIGPDGRFTLNCYEDNDGAVTGTHRVAVIANEPVGENEMRWHAPERFADYATSGIEVEISGPTDDLKIEISSAEQ